MDNVDMINKVEHPFHYVWLKDVAWIEVIDITRHMSFNIGNSLKYILRAGHKSEEGMSDIDKQIEDLEKAKWYLTDYIENILKPIKEKQWQKRNMN